LNRVGIVAALASEARALAPEHRALAPRGEVLALEDHALLSVSGMGWDAAHAGAERLVRSGATALASFGTAGALDPALECGAVIVPREVRVLDGPALPTHARWREALLAALPRDCQVSDGALLTSAVPLGSRLDKAIAWRESGCVAVDMESAAVAERAAAAAVPFLVLRVIVDTAADDLPEAVLAASGAGGVAIGRLVLGLAFAPVSIPAVRSLARRFRIACGMLARLAEPGLPARRALTAQHGVGAH
jgi:adenosylhomocysteine nucleosidase